MIQSIEATIDKKGNVKLKEKIDLKCVHRAIVTILDDIPIDDVTLLSEKVLAREWLTEEEDDAWKHLQ